MDGSRGVFVFSPDNRLVFGSSENGDLNIWEMATGKRLAKLNAHRGTVSALQVNAAGTLVASSGDDAVIRLWAVPPQATF